MCVCLSLFVYLDGLFTQKSDPDPNPTTLRHPPTTNRASTTARRLLRRLFPPPLDPPALFQVPVDFEQHDQFSFVGPEELISDVVSRCVRVDRVDCVL